MRVFKLNRKGRRGGFPERTPRGKQWGMETRRIPDETDFSYFSIFCLFSKKKGKHHQNPFMEDLQQN